MRKLLALLIVSVLALTGCGKASDTHVVVYSNALTDEVQAFLTERGEQDGFSFDFVDLPNQDLYNRLVAEKNKPVADVVFGLDDIMFSGLKDEGLLYQYTPDWTKDVPQDLLEGTDGYFAPTVEQRIMMVYNKEYYNEDTAPTSWQDLVTNPAFKNKYFVPVSTTSGTNQKVYFSILSQYRDDNAKDGVSDEGWKFFEDYYKGGVEVPTDENYWDYFKDGRAPIGYAFSGSIASTEEQNGFEMGIVNPKQGVISMNEQVGIVNKGEDNDYTNAKKFVDWFGSADVQRDYAKELNTMPLNSKAQDGETDSIKSISEATDPMDTDWKYIAKYKDAWIEKIELQIIGS